MAYKLVLKGKVHGVGCRYYCSKTALALGLHGSATNVSDGSVSVLIKTDDPGTVRRFAEALRENVFNYHFFGQFSSVDYELYDGPITGDYNW
jgi:acylphosphatase